ncbi:uncharacterized protein LOC132605202 isoform X2 [Lycium barbarum]|uniref:uncharacterized protein LOC132605202 isoform X2 n=1 Tax=Lycium barbarum TaxID=112863 RepID=UPI00293E66A1|nr:uncharacterized protein LOC132605202 isoform X2 [Lycium barbarum]
MARKLKIMNLRSFLLSVMVPPLYYPSIFKFTYAYINKQGSGGVKVIEEKRKTSSDQNEEYPDIRADFDEQEAKGEVDWEDGCVPISGQDAAYWKNQSHSGTSIGVHDGFGEACDKGLDDPEALKNQSHSFTSIGVHDGFGEACGNGLFNQEAFKIHTNNDPISVSVHDGVAEARDKCLDVIVHDGVVKARDKCLDGKTISLMQFKRLIKYML